MKSAIAIAVFLSAYTLIATEWVHRVVVVLAGAGLMFLFQVVDVHDAFASEETGVDWNVIFLLFGMMVIVGVLRHTGFFEFLAIWSAKRARGDPLRVMVLLVLITAAASALLDNVTTLLLLAPVTLLLAERLGIAPVPLLLAEVFASNIGGTATLIGDPPNIIIGSRAGLTYIDFLVHLAPVVLVLIVLFLILASRMFRSALVPHPERVEHVMSLDEREALEEGPLLARALAVLAVVTAAFAFHGVIGYEPSIIALLGAGILLLIARESFERFLAEVEWQTLVFFMGLFVMVGGLVKVGAIDALAERVIAVTGGNLLLATMLVLVVSAIASAIVDNVPFVATMTPVVLALAESIPGDTTVLWWALALGADLGGNATSIGASANVVVLGTADRAGHHISFGRFFRYGAPVTAMSIAVSALYLWLRYFAFA
ncbi:MAG TPA: ArsB/NhaD family transporter [Actinomycetota bacterium]|jgi:Na+/H+ antiporter NhaD/arsenite permease-like protein|nr:ArsB/NhaD family transporter [Actinomycetota bacterium]